MDGNILLSIDFKISQNLTLMLNVKKSTVKKYSDNDQLKIKVGSNNQYVVEEVDADREEFRNVNINNRNYCKFVLSRKLSTEDIESVKMHDMPGLRLSWKYNVKDVAISEYKENPTYAQFVRYRISFFFSHMYP